MAHVVVLFNLLEGVDSSEYERWALDRDVPTVRGLPSVESFRVLRATTLLGGEASPYSYIEIIEVTGIDDLITDVQSPAMKKIAGEFAAFADNPTFIVTNELGS